MKTRTEEEALERMEKQCLIDVKAGLTVSNFKTVDSELKYNWIDNGGDRSGVAVFKFTHPRPIHSTDTVGYFSNEDFKHCEHLGRYGKTISYSKYDRHKDHLGSEWDTFTPIIKNDPAIEKALFLMADSCAELDTFRDEDGEPMDKDDAVIYFVALANKELTNDR